MNVPPELLSLADIKWAIVLSLGLRILLVMGGAWVAIRLVKTVFSRWLQRVLPPEGEEQNEYHHRLHTISLITTQITTVAIWLVAGIVIMALLGINVGPILAGAGILGIALGLGAQHLVRDFLSGTFILIEDQFSVGDIIKTAGVAGLVQSISLRSTTLRDIEGNVHVIPNGKIDVVTNMTKQWSRVVLDLGVAYKENTDKVVEILHLVGEEMASDQRLASYLIDPMEIPGIQSFGDSAVHIRCMLKTKPGKQWEVGRELRRKIKLALDGAGIEIPFPHRTLYLGHNQEDRLLQLATPADHPSPQRPRDRFESSRSSFT